MFWHGIASNDRPMKRLLKTQATALHSHDTSEFRLGEPLQQGWQPREPLTNRPPFPQKK
jgi:hypothetical protein